MDPLVYKAATGGRAEILRCPEAFFSLPGATGGRGFIAWARRHRSGATGGRGFIFFHARLAGLRSVLLLGVGLFSLRLAKEPDAFQCPIDFFEGLLAEIRDS